MSKIKTPSTIKVRFKITASGKIMRRSQGMRHLRRRKSKSGIRAYRVPKEVKGRMANKIRRLLGIKKPKDKLYEQGTPVN